MENPIISPSSIKNTRNVDSGDISGRSWAIIKAKGNNFMKRISYKGMGSSSTNYAITEMDTKKNTSGAAAVSLLIIPMMSVIYG